MAWTTQSHYFDKNLIDCENFQMICKPYKIWKTYKMLNSWMISCSKEYYKKKFQFPTKQIWLPRVVKPSLVVFDVSSRFPGFVALRSECTIAYSKNLDSRELAG